MIKTKLQVFCIQAINVKENREIEGCYTKMQKKVAISKKEYIEVFANINKCTHMVKYRDFQYRLLVNAIFTNDRLYYWKKVDSQMCNFCNTTKQTVVHMLCECEITRTIWIKFEEFVRRCLIGITKDEITMSTKNIIINCIHNDPQHIVNLLLLITKQYIFYCKCVGKQPIFNEIVKKYEETYEVEMYNSKVDYNMRNLVRKWAPYSGLTLR